MERALAGQAVSNEHEVARRDLAFEFMLGGFRLREGFDLETCLERTGLPPSAVLPRLEAARERGLVLHERRDGRDLWRASERGFDFLSDLQAMFLSKRSGADT
jgi:oxygen-independent coproporphyrinogen-3 oxidase